MSIKILVAHARDQNNKIISAKRCQELEITGDSNKITLMLSFCSSSQYVKHGQVCRAGCQACAEVLLSLGKAMEAEVETLVKELLQKSSDTNKFIRQKISNKIQS